MEGNGKGTIAKWKDKHRRMYDQATHHPFILSIRDGAVDYSNFKRWLGQDYIFVRQFIPFVASVLLKSWKESNEESDMEVLLGGMASLNDEISWFKRQADKWDVHDLHSLVPQQANLNYCMFLESLMKPEVEYIVAITAFWAVEAVYQESFSLCLESSAKTPLQLMETCQRWGNSGFREYCVSLQKIADRCLENAPDDVLVKAEAAFTNVLQHEVSFWDMSSA